jgi:hypothetical protein
LESKSGFSKEKCTVRETYLQTKELPMSLKAQETRVRSEITVQDEEKEITNFHP